MAICPYAQFAQHRGGAAAAFPEGAPFGITLHRTRTGWGQAQKFVTSGKYPHFMVGTEPSSGVRTAGGTTPWGGLIQYEDTAYQTAHHRGENAKYIGIEFQSADAEDYNAVPLSNYQLAIGNLLVGWICDTHGIARKGPPSVKQVNKMERNVHGIISHADIQKGWNPGAKSNHGDRLSASDFAALGIAPWS
ncbi:hypothetical protein [Sphingomonas sp.]|uniref:hypothetical protein n=1 Tax=Sphingomonas sp. TaxID=28214 RepID=UPI003CC58C49